MENTDLEKNIEIIKEGLGSQPSIIIRKFLIGTSNPLDAAIIYINGFIKPDRIEDAILKPLMQQVNEQLEQENICDYLLRKYILIGNGWVDNDFNHIILMLKEGKTALILNGSTDVILLDTTGGEYRSITEPNNETVLKGSKEGFIENIDINISLVKRRIKDSNFVADKSLVGRRSQSEVAILYVKDIVDMDIVNEVRNRIKDIDVDIVTSVGILMQYIEDYTYSIFPQSFLTEKPDVVSYNLMEGRIAVMVSGTPLVALVPCLFTDFFHNIEDYTQRTILANFDRIIRYLAFFTIITLPSIYLTLVKFNAELIPIKFIAPIVQSRIGIALTPFLEIFLMEIVVEFLREGGLRLPTKIGQTLSVVGGIIIGDTAVKSRIVSPTTLFVVGITVVATFLIPNYDMSLCVRLLRFPMLMLANFLGILGIGLGWFFILHTLCSLDSFGVPYFSLNKGDRKDFIFRYPLWKMNQRPEAIPNNNSTRQTDFRHKWAMPRRKKNEESGE